MQLEAPSVNFGRMGRRPKKTDAPRRNVVEDALFSYTWLTLVPSNREKYGAFKPSKDGSIPDGAIQAIAEHLGLTEQPLGNMLSKWKKNGRVRPCVKEQHIRALFKLAKGSKTHPGVLLSGNPGFKADDDDAQ